MFPFHRHHSNSTTSTSSSAAHKIKPNGNSRSRERGYSREDEVDEVLPRHQPRSQSHSQLQQQRWDYVLDQTTNVLRAKENVLLSSIAASGGHQCTNSSLRRGSDKHNNIFSSLQNLKEAATADEGDDEVPSRRVIDSSAVKRFFLEGLSQMSSFKSSDRLQGNIHAEPSDKPAPVNSLWSEALQTAIVNQVNINTKLLKSSFEDSRDEDTRDEDTRDEGASVEERDDVLTRGLPLLLVEHSPGDETAQQSSETSAINREHTTSADKMYHVEEVNVVDHGKRVEGAEGVVADDVEDVNVVDHDTRVEGAEGVTAVVADDVEDVNVVDHDKRVEGAEGVEDELAVGTTPISLSTAVGLKRLLLGSPSAQFPRSWLDQEFAFNSNHRLRYGLLQDKEALCGIVAIIQALLFKALLFDPDKCSCTDPLRPTGSEARTALITAICDVLWRASARHRPSLVMGSDDVVLADADGYRRDGLTETLVVATFDSRASLEHGVKQHLDRLMTPGKSGCLLVALSAILSRGVGRVERDMDVCTSRLIGCDDQCHMELVNLLLTGRAVSNMFDNTIDTDSGLLRGVHTRSEVGFLTLREHTNVCQVGSYLKTPRYPVWVVEREARYSVLFSCKRELVSDWRVEKHFTLFHYDAVAKQKDEVALVVDTGGLHSRARADGYVAPTLELCIRTKWKGAVVDWKNESSH